MGHSSQSGNVVLRSQTTAGIPEPDLATAGVGVKIMSGSIGPNRTPIIAEKEIGGGRDVVDAQLGPTGFSGEYSLYPRFDSLPTILRACLGTASTVTATGVSTHTITPTDGQTPLLSVYEEISAGFERFLFNDVKVNTFGLEIDATGLITATAALVGKKGVSGATDVAADALYDNTALVPGYTVSVTFDGIELLPKSFSCTINNNVEDDDFRIGSKYVGDLTDKGRDVSGSFTIRHEDATMFKKAVWGSTSATEPGGQSYKGALVVTVEAFEMIGATAEPYGFTLTFPKVFISPFKLDPSGDDALQNDVEWTAVRPDPAVKILTAVVKNGKTAIA